MDKKHNEQQYKLFAEAFHEVVIPELKEIKNDLTTLLKRTDNIEVKISKIDDKLDRHDSRIDSHEKRISKLELTSDRI